MFNSAQNCCRLPRIKVFQYGNRSLTEIKFVQSLTPRKRGRKLWKFKTRVVKSYVFFVERFGQPVQILEGSFPKKKRKKKPNKQKPISQNLKTLQSSNSTVQSSQIKQQETRIKDFTFWKRGLDMWIHQIKKQIEGNDDEDMRRYKRKKHT